MRKISVHAYKKFEFNSELKQSSNSIKICVDAQAMGSKQIYDTLLCCFYFDKNASFWSGNLINP